MKANVKYNDFKGTAAADMSDYVTQFSGDTLESFSDLFKVDKKRFKIVGISFYGREKPSISLLCVDLEESTFDKEHIVNMSVEWNSERHPLEVLFKRFDVVLHEKFDEKYPHLDFDREVRYEDYHEILEDQEVEDEE